jgi:hypothetical protein
MAVKHKLLRGPGNSWIYPKLKGVLEECGLSALVEYITVRQQMITVNVVTRPILTKCRQCERKGEQYCTAGGGSNRWTWTPMMQLDQTSDSPG